MKWEILICEIECLLFPFVLEIDFGLFFPYFHNNHAEIKFHPRIPVKETPCVFGFPSVEHDIVITTEINPGWNYHLVLSLSLSVLYIRTGCFSFHPRVSIVSATWNWPPTTHWKRTLVRQISFRVQTNSIFRVLGSHERMLSSLIHPSTLPSIRYEYLLLAFALGSVSLKKDLTNKRTISDEVYITVSKHRHDMDTNSHHLVLGWQSRRLLSREIEHLCPKSNGE